MNLIQTCAINFQKLQAYEYHFIIGRKGNLKDFYLTFDKADFHHLLGLHKLRDIAQIQQGMREKIFDKILSGEISEELVKKSAFYNQMESRLIPLISLEEMLDGNNIIKCVERSLKSVTLIIALVNLNIHY